MEVATMMSNCLKEPTFIQEKEDIQDRKSRLEQKEKKIA